MLAYILRKTTKILSDIKMKFSITKLNIRFFIWLCVLVSLIVSPLISIYDTNAVFAFIGIFYFAILLMSYWIWIDGRKIEHLENALNILKAKDVKKYFKRKWLF